MDTAETIQFIQRATETGQGEIDPLKLSRVLARLSPEQRAALDQMCQELGIEDAADGLALFWRATNAARRAQMKHIA